MLQRALILLVLCGAATPAAARALCGGAVSGAIVPRQSLSGSWAANSTFVCLLGATPCPSRLAPDWGPASLAAEPRERVHKPLLPLEGRDLLGFTAVMAAVL